jgi:NADH:ubiquinone oxidoreductase subunit F (NADH-binding)
MKQPYFQELIDEYCGGISDGHSFAAYLPGGASGGILPASMNDIPLAVLHQHAGLLRARAAGRALAAGLVLEELHQVQRGTAHIVLILAQCMRDASICGLGQAASNPVSTVIKYFPDLFPEPRAVAAE